MSIPTSTPGRTIGTRYRLGASIGSGGMGTVWRAHDELLRRDVAVKEVLLPPGLPDDERAMLCERTLREARAAASLTHPAVITVYDVVEEDDRPWIVMELLEARSLAEMVREDGPLPPAQVADVALQVLGALEAAHRAGILHRDVKPGNILVSREGRATLTDFGVARAPGDSQLTSTGLLLGSPSYISPERAHGEAPGPASDLWGLGATLYAAVEGHPPFDKGDPLPTLTAVVSDAPAPPQHAGPLTPVLAGLLTKEVGERWDVARTRAGLHDALRRLAGTEQTPAAPVPPAVPDADAQPTEVVRALPARPSGRPRRRGPIAAAAVVAVLLAGGVGYASSQLAGGPDTKPGTTQRAADVAAKTYQKHTDKLGFAVTIPRGWEGKRAGNTVNFYDPDGGRFLRFRVEPTKADDQLSIFDAGEQTFESRDDVSDYSRVRIGEVDVAGHPGAVWEFTYTEPTTHESRHVLYEGFLRDGKSYQLYLSTRKDQFAASAKIFKTALSTYRVTD